MGLGTWRSNSRQSFEAPPGEGKAWGAARAPGDDDYSLEGTRMRTLGRGIEGIGAVDAGPRVRNKGLGIEGRPPRKESAHARKASAATAASSIAKDSSASVEYNEVSPTDEDESAPRTSAAKQNAQTTLALLQTFHANTCFWLSKLREAVPPPSAISSPGGPNSRRYRDYAGVSSNDTDVDDEVITITARDLLSLELGILSDLDARFVEWLVEAEEYASASTSAESYTSSAPTRPRRGQKVVVKRGWQELFGIMVGLK